jgi:hypothetical protein
MVKELNQIVNFLFQMYLNTEVLTHLNVFGHKFFCFVSGNMLGSEHSGDNRIEEVHSLCFFC